MEGRRGERWRGGSLTGLVGVLAHGQALCHTPPFCADLRPRGRSFWVKVRGHNGAGSGHCWPPSRRRVVPQGTLLGEEAELPGPLPPGRPARKSHRSSQCGPGHGWDLPLGGLGVAAWLLLTLSPGPSTSRALQRMGGGPSLVSYSVI